MKVYYHVYEDGESYIREINGIPLVDPNKDVGPFGCNLKPGDEVSIYEGTDEDKEPKKEFSKWTVVKVGPEKFHFRGKAYFNLVLAMKNRSRSVPGYPEDMESIRKANFCGDLEFMYCAAFKRLKEIQEILDIAAGKLVKYKSVYGFDVAVKQHEEIEKYFSQAKSLLCEQIYLVPSE